MGEKSFEKIGGRLHNANMCLSNFICTRTHTDGLMGHGPRLRNADNDIHWNDPQMSFSVIGRGTNRKLVYEMTQQNLQFHFGADRERNVQFTMRNVLLLVR